MEGDDVHKPPSYKTTAATEKKASLDPVTMTILGSLISD